MKKLSAEELQTVDTYNSHPYYAGQDQDWQAVAYRFHAIAEHIANRRVLEIGSGIGKMLPFFVQAKYEYTGIDVSTEAVKIAQAHYPEHAQQFVCMNCCELGFDEGTFDGVFAVNVFCHIPKSKALHVLGQIHQVLRPSGKLVIVMVDVSRPFEQMVTVEDLKAPNQVLLSLYTKSEFFACLKQARFRDITVHEDMMSNMYVCSK